MNNSDIKEAAKSLHDSRINAQKRDQLTKEFEGLNLKNAYKIQKHGIELRYTNGETYSGMKMGLTSEAKRKQMGLDSPVYGQLTDKMEIENGSKFSLKGSIHPKIEPEIAFRIEKPIKHGAETNDILDSISGVSAALEILDTRYTAFKYFSLEDVVADNSSSFKYVLGPWKSDFTNLDWENLRMNFQVNGVTAHEGVSSAISGHPIQSIVELLNLLNKNGEELQVPCVVLAGAATPAITLEPESKIELIVDDLEPVCLEVRK